MKTGIEDRTIGIVLVYVPRTLASRWIKQKFRCYEAKIEESEKAGSRRESNPGHLACAASALPLSYDNHSAARMGAA